jgi:DNA invertase Pin-like site-specific DNA recombinase
MKKEKEKEKEKRIETILKYKIKGYTLSAIGNMLHVSRARIGKIIQTNKNNPKYQNLYKEIEKTNKFLSRKIN